MYQTMSQILVASQKTTSLKFLRSVLEVYVRRSVFVTLEQHIRDCAAHDSYFIFLFKGIAEQYFEVRLHYLM